ncbi:MAG TPA: hypothetical protein VGR97_08090, partial [Candidatus Acidoferrales bacterium]|nr:hypothetical protein [Candidatus Acidoferrales bacterium]
TTQFSIISRIVNRSVISSFIGTPTLNMKIAAEVYTDSTIWDQRFRKQLCGLPIASTYVRRQECLRHG